MVLCEFLGTPLTPALYYRWQRRSQYLHGLIGSWFSNQCIGFRAGTRLEFALRPGAGAPVGSVVSLHLAQVASSLSYLAVGRSPHVALLLDHRRVGSVAVVAGELD